jgi:hypothetical protein
MSARRILSAFALMILTLAVTDLAAGCGGSDDGPEGRTQQTQEARAATQAGQPEESTAEVQEADQTEESEADVHLILSEDSVESQGSVMASPSVSSASATFLIENQTHEERAWALVRVNREGTVHVGEGYTDVPLFDPEPIQQGILAAGASDGFVVDLAPAQYMVLSWQTPPAGQPADGHIRITSARENLILIDAQWVPVSSWTMPAGFPVHGR